MKNIIMAILVIAVVGFVGYFIIKSSPRTADVAKVEDNVTSTTTPQSDGQTSGTPVVEKNKAETIIGKSINERDIMAYHYGTGDTELLFVGGIHGGYSWNTTLLAYEMVDYLEANPTVVPANIKVTVVPVMNPDGLEKVTGSTGRFEPEDVSPSNAVQVSGRFNANNVDLSRNFDCEWQTNALWQNKPVSGGATVFSEPESVAMKNYIEASTPSAVVVWYSAEGKVYASSCGAPVLTETTVITNLFAKASGYPAGQNFTAYKITGDFVDWLAKKEIPAISVLLTNHQDVEWTKNKAGFEALLAKYSTE